MKLQSGQEGYSELFAQEVRRFYPLFPFVPAKVRREFTWKGYRFPNEVRVMLDLYGTNQDPREWDAPREFRPERFLTWAGSPFNFIPQGGGDHFTGHRCAGEWLTIELIKSGAEILTTDMAYDVPEQDLSISLSRMPANVKSGFVINNVRRLRVTEGARV